MTTHKCLTLGLASNKSNGASFSIQLPTTSATDSNQQTAYSNNTVTNSVNDSNNNSYQLDQNNNNQATGISNPLNYCHHNSVARILLLDHRRPSSSTTLTATSDHSTDHNNNNQQPNEPTGTPPPNYHEIPGIVPAYQGRTSGPPPAYDDVVNPDAPPPSYQSLFGQVREARKTSNGFVDLCRQLFLILIGTIGCTMIIGFLLLIPITMILVGFFYVNDCRAENIPSFLVIGGFVWIVKNILNCYNQFKKDSLTSNRPPPRRTPISPASTSSSSSQSGNQRASSSAMLAATADDNSTDNNNNSPANFQSSSNTSTTTRPIRSTTTNPSDTSNVNRIRHPTMIGLTSFKCESMLNYFLIVWFLAGCIVVYRIYEPDYDNPLSATYCNRTVYLYAFWLMTSAFIILAIILSCFCCLMASSLISCNHRR